MRRPDKPSISGLIALLNESERLLLGFERSPPGRLLQSSGWKPDDFSEYCSTCGIGVRPLRFACGCTDGVRRPHANVVRLGAYAEPLSSWVCMIKFERWRSMGELLARHLADALAASLEVTCPDRRKPLLVPVPMPRIRRFSRGIDHTRVLVDVISARNGWPSRRVLRQTSGRPQAASNASQRASRRNPFRWNGRARSLEGQDVILVDDVLTTGRTARSAARLLRARGAGRVTLGVIAVTESRGS
jgi:ComF family protein